MADRDNGKVEHPLTLGPKHWEEEEEGVLCVCVTGVEGAGSRVGEGCLGRKIHLMVFSDTHTHSQTHLLK